MGVVEAGGAMAGSQMGQGVRARSSRWQGMEGMVGAGGPDGNCWGWCGRSIVGQEGSDGQEGGNGRVHEGQMAVAGGSWGGME